MLRELVGLLKEVRDLPSDRLPRVLVVLLMSILAATAVIVALRVLLTELWKLGEAARPFIERLWIAMDSYNASLSFIIESLMPRLVFLLLFASLIFSVRQ